MKIEFVLRTPGNHKRVATKDLDCVPRVGELVVLGDDASSHYVHQVTHFIERNYVSVLLTV